MRILDRLSRKEARLIIKKLIMIGIVVLVSTALIAVSGCAVQETTREGYKTYSKYGFSFEYPQSFLAFEQGLLESQANDTSGVVAASVENEELKAVGVMWFKVQESLVDQVTLEAGMEGGFQGMAGGEDVVSVEPGELVETTKAGHRMLYQYYALTTTEGDKTFGIYGSWYCDKDQKIYILSTENNTISSKKDVLRDYQSYLDYFVCH